MNSIIKAICTFSLVLLLFVATTLQGQDVVKGNLSPRNAPYDQPLKGWAPYTNAGTIHQPTAWYFFTSPGKIWSLLKESTNLNSGSKQIGPTLMQKGKHVIFRIYMDYPTKEKWNPKLATC